MMEEGKKEAAKEVKKEYVQVAPKAPLQVKVAGGREAAFPLNPVKTYGLMAVVKGEAISGATKEAEVSLKKRVREEVFVWPDLVYNEWISCLVVSALLFYFAIAYDAPLEELAALDITPNPMKAPWYFLGLQELLIYYDPWAAGVVIPGFIIIGLILIPYLDPNPAGVGTFNWSKRKFAVASFAFGLALWLSLIVIGVYIRHLDMQWYWPWDNPLEHKPPSSVVLTDLNILLMRWFGVSEAVSHWMAFGSFIGYYVVGFTIPFIFFRKFYNSLGFVRYNLVMFLYLTMMHVPLKLLMRLVFTIKYQVVTPWIKI